MGPRLLKLKWKIGSKIYFIKLIKNGRMETMKEEKNLQPVEMEIRRGIQAGRKNVLNLIKLIAEKADDVQPAISQGVLNVVEDTKDLQKKSKPLVDAIVKVNEVIESPEFRSFMDEIEDVGKSLSKVFQYKSNKGYEGHYGYYNYPPP